MIDWKRKLTSRKFWTAVAGFVSMLIVFFGGAEELATQVTSLILAGATVIAYVLAEGFVDANAGGEYIAEAVEIAGTAEQKEDKTPNTGGDGNA